VANISTSVQPRISVPTRTSIRLRKVLPYLLIAPSLAVFLVFDIWPIIYSFYLSFMKWNLLSPKKTFVGLDNYITIFTSEEFLKALWHTVVFTIGRVGGSLTFALLLALLLNTQKRWVSWVQASIFSPHVVSMVSISMLWLWLMDPNHGLLNYLLSLVGLPPSRWLAGVDTALLSVIIVTVWKAIGYDMVIFLSGLQAIPEELHEAAKIDGANSFQRFWKITFPLLSPTTFFLTVTSIIASFQVFDSVRVMTGGGPVDATTVLVFYIYQHGFRFYKIGQATAASTVLFLIILILTVLQFKYAEKKVHYD